MFAVTLRGVWHVMFPDPHCQLQHAVSELSSRVQGSELLQLLHPLLENTGETTGLGRAGRTLQTRLVPILGEEIKKI